MDKDFASKHAVTLWQMTILTWVFKCLVGASYSKFCIKEKSTCFGNQSIVNVMKRLLEA